MEISSGEKVKLTNASIRASNVDSGDLESEPDRSSEDVKYKKSHDAEFIEYCPRVFRELRKIDEYTAKDLKK